MKIILATPLYPPEIGGPATYTVELAEYLSQKHKVVVVAYADDAKKLPNTELLVVSKRQPLPIRLIKYFFVLLRASGGGDVIYVQNAVAAGLPAVVVGFLRRTPVVVKFVGDEAWERAVGAKRTSKQLEEFYKSKEGGLHTKIVMAIERFVLRNVTAVTTPSLYLSELLIKYYGVKREKAFVNYNAVNVEVSPNVPRIGHQVVTAVRLVEHKGIPGIIDAAAQLVEKFPDIKLVIAGEGPERANLEKKIQELPDWQKHFSLVGRLPKNEVLKLQAQSEVQVLNSSYEGLPFGVLESFATRTPIVATDIAGTNEAVYNEKTGLLVPVGDTDALAAAIERLFTNATLREQVVRGGEQLLKEKFSWSAHLQVLEKLFVLY